MIRAARHPMISLEKLQTAATLVKRAEWRALRTQIALNFRRLCVAMLHRHQPFVHRRLGFAFACFPAVSDSLELYYRGGGEDTLELTLLQSWLERDDAVIDAGANLGVYAIAAAQKLGSEGRVVAIEPSRMLADCIANSARLLGLDAITVLSCCVGERVGDTEFFVANDGRPTCEQSRSVAPEFRQDYQRTSVPMLTFDAVIQAHFAGPVAFIKLDIEGAELLALRGATALLAAPDPPLWLVEINPRALSRFRAAAADVTAFFPSADYDHWLLPHYLHSGARTQPRRGTHTERFDDALFYNLVALPRRGRFAPRASRVRSLLQSS